MRKGSKHSLKAKRKLARSVRNLWRDPEKRRRMLRGRAEKIRTGIKKAWADPEFRELTSQKNRENMLMFYEKRRRANPDCTLSRGRVSAIAFPPDRLRKGLQIGLPFEPRKGVCQNCDRTRKQGEKKFHMHHDRYVIGKPLAYTRELCPSCHMKHHHERGEAKAWGRAYAKRPA